MEHGVTHLLDWRGQIEPPHKVHQTSFGEEGNCLAACVASLHDVNIQDTPNFALLDDWWSEFQMWMNDHTGLWPITTKRFGAIRGSFIGTGLGERGLLHSVVCVRTERLGVGVIWDPHPEAKRIPESLDYGIVYQCIIT